MTQVDGVIYCRFTRQAKIQISKNLVFDLDNNDFYVMVARGPLAAGNFWEAKWTCRGSLTLYICVYNIVHPIVGAVVCCFQYTYIVYTEPYLIDKL